MRHRAQRKNFGRDHDHKKAMWRNMVGSLVEHGRIRTTLPKAKELRKFAERAVTLGKRENLNARRVLLSRLPNKAVVQKVFEDLAPRFKDRNGGYTRIIKLGPRPGDNAPMAFIEWVDYENAAPATAGKTAKAASKKGIDSISEDGVKKKVAKKKTTAKKKAKKKTTKS